MIYPINYISITQYHHVGKHIDFGWCGHHNQDIMAVDDGIIYKKEWQTTGGNVVYIKHNTGLISAYGHMKSVCVKKGQKVKKGEKIGVMGATGSMATGEHLDFALYSKGSNVYKNSDLDPFEFLQVQDYQHVATTGSTVKYKDKFLYAPENERIEAKKMYRLLVAKAIRTSPSLTNNIVKVKECRSDVKKDLTSTNPNDDAYFKVGTDVNITEVIRESNGRIWGKLRNCYIVLCNKDGTMQCEKLK